MEGQNSSAAMRAAADGRSGIPIVNVENACASSSTGLREAYAHIKAGLCDGRARRRRREDVLPRPEGPMFRAFSAAPTCICVEDTRKRLARRRGRARRANARRRCASHSLFMDIYAALARFHMRIVRHHGRASCAAAAAKNHDHSTHESAAPNTGRHDVEAVLQDARSPGR